MSNNNRPDQRVAGDGSSFRPELTPIEIRPSSTSPFGDGFSRMPLDGEAQPILRVTDPVRMPPARISPGVSPSTVLINRPIQFDPVALPGKTVRSTPVGNPNDAHDVAAALSLNKTTFSMDVPSLGKELLVLRFSGTESISELYEFRLTILSTDPDLPVEEILNQNAHLLLSGPDDTPLPISGIVSDFQQTGRYIDTYMYEATLVPTAWRLSLNYQTRVFQNATVDQIVTRVMQKTGMVAERDFEFRLDRSLSPREYTTQYRETDLNFVSRLLEHEGIHFYFEQSRAGEKMVISDRSMTNPTIPGEAVVPFNQAHGMNADTRLENECINQFTYKASLVTGRVILKDYNYESPNADMLVDSQINNQMPGTYYEYGDHFKDRGEGAELAEIRNQEIESHRVTISGSGTSTRFRVGHRWTLGDHFREDLNADYLITSVEHSGDQTNQVLGSLLENPDPGYHCSFVCIPASVRFRPERKTETPQLPGIMTARIESAGGDYAYLDDDGRYRVKMPFDLDETPEGEGSKPVRLAQPYSGLDYGIHFPHHENTEMIWACVDGNLDRPLGLGTAPNPNNTSPAVAANRPQNVIRTWGKNELTFDDTSGQENILMIATKDHTVQVANDESFTVDHDQSMHVKNDRTITVDHDETVTIKNDQTITVTNDQKVTVENEQTLDVSANRTKTVKQNETNRIEGQRETTVVQGETLTVDSGGRTITVSSGDQTTSVVAGSRNLTVNGSDSHTVESGSRTVTVQSGDDNLTVNGSRTTTVQSGNYLLDVGGASATIQCGASSLTLNSDGTIVLSGNSVRVEAGAHYDLSADLIETRGSTIEQTASGKTRISAPSMFVQGSQIAAVQGPIVEMNGSSRYS